MASGKDHSCSQARQRPFHCCQLSSNLITVRVVMDRLILHRISPTLDDTIVVVEAGFRHGRSTCDQVFALTTFTENGFQLKQKTGVIFLDLTAAYNTVWHLGLLVKLSKVIPQWAVDMIALFFRDRFFRVHIGSRCSSGDTKRPVYHRAQYFPQACSTCTLMICTQQHQGNSSMLMTCVWVPSVTLSPTWMMCSMEIWIH